MDEDEIFEHSVSPIIEEVDNVEDSKQAKSLEIYLKSLPYECESTEDMLSTLNCIVQNLVLTARTANWSVNVGWDETLQYWLIMRYPMPRIVRAGLARFYFELIVTPGIEARYLKTWANTFHKLIPNAAGERRKLEPTDLQLPWRDLWTVIVPEVWHGPDTELLRNVAPALISVAETSSRYFNPADVEDIINAVLTRFEPNNVVQDVTVLMSLLPPVNVQMYLPIFFRIWEAFNSSQLDERMLEFSGSLAQECVSVEFDGPSTPAWKDVGIFTAEQWAKICRTALVFMQVPVGGGNSNTGTTGGHVDSGQSNRPLRKGGNVHQHLATIFVYSMFSDLEGDDFGGTCAHSKSLRSLTTIITSVETYFHPSNHGTWTGQLTTFLQRLTYAFSKRWTEEHFPDCKTPPHHRLTDHVKRKFVELLQTPALLSMFAKDPVSIALSHASLKTLAVLEPDIILPSIIERAYSGLESVNETHRATAVLSCLSAVASTLVNENLFLGGQRHLIPLLEQALPGLDINDPLKTICSTMFISAAISSIKVGNISGQVALTLGDDAPVAIEADGTVMPEGTEGPGSKLNRNEERALLRDSTASFPDWVTSFFRRIFALFENLPEEGGKSSKIGGKSEETLLKSIRTTLDIMASHLSDPLFDLVLGIVYDYAITNARANSVRAFSNLVASLGKANPKKTLDKFWKHCTEQIKIELENGASSLRTTSTSLPIASDTTLHWYLGILRGITSTGGYELITYKDEIFVMLKLLVAKTKNERGYNNTGRLVGRLLAALINIYPLEQRLVNDDEWNSKKFEQTHYQAWGRIYRPEDVVINWHVPRDAEIDFAMEILDQIINPCLDALEGLLRVPSNSREAVWRNDFCRYLYIVRSAWSGLPTFILGREEPMVDDKTLDPTTELASLSADALRMKCGFVLTKRDRRYTVALGHRERFGQFLHNASVSLTHSESKDASDDHIDAVMAVNKGIDTYLLDYGMTRASYATQKKLYDSTRDLCLSVGKQKLFPRQVWVKRAHAYHALRVLTHSLYRTRKTLDDLLIKDLVEFSLSPYTRVRKSSQAIVANIISYFIRSSRIVLAQVFEALQKQSDLGKAGDPDRQKGALYLLWNRSLASYALSTPKYLPSFYHSLLSLQYQEKPSIQQLVAAIIEDSLGQVTLESLDVSMSASLPSPRFVKLIDNLESLCGSSDPSLTQLVIERREPRLQLKVDKYNQTCQEICTIARSNETHWKYQQWSMALLLRLTRKDHPATSEVALLFAENILSDHPNTRSYAQKGLSRLLRFIKSRTFSKTPQDLWLNRHFNPLRAEFQFQDLNTFLESQERQSSIPSDTIYYDKVPHGALVWNQTVRGYRKPPQDLPVFQWESESLDLLTALRGYLDEAWFSHLLNLWAQEGERSNTTTDLRAENTTLIKILFYVLQGAHTSLVLPLLDPFLRDPDKHRLRAGLEFLGGLVRGSKHFPGQLISQMSNWVTARLPAILALITPDTVTLWDSFLGLLFQNRDPRRTRSFVDFVLDQPVDFNGASVFSLTKTLSSVASLADGLSVRFLPYSHKYLDAFFENLGTPYAEVRTQIVATILIIGNLTWCPSHPSATVLARRCASDEDPLLVRETRYMSRLLKLSDQFEKWRNERLPGAWVSQSMYDKVGLTLLTWIWSTAYSIGAPSIFAYTHPFLPEIFRMSELQDSSELQSYSSGVLYVLSAVAPPTEYVGSLTESFISAIRMSPSWRVRHKAIPVLSVWYFRNLPNLSQDMINRVMEVLVECLRDENVEVRETSATTLSGVLRCSQKSNVIALKDRFVRNALRAKLPKRSDPEYSDALRRLHSAILGMIATLQAYPYVVESWMPSLIETLSRFSSEPQPISSAIRKFAATFKRTHQDTWHLDQHLFDEDQAQALATMLTGTSYYA
ncbi:uncharacterized protein EI90DRAFT_3063646 [Cantharellus anzutake]|uniref:uncharacterized protein n=1 Tax=Cantharellus anzutake TaxID=1750568 RepID=UPI001905DEE8|nr:uncharacterized protein EI90DRAFT_3063646 [Cantharellus anzutake]KAF8328806.1 hypothetical protein EI90DRAFT_3063646 [Cantharellus anzutake]